MRAITQCGIGLILLLCAVSPVFADSTFVKFGASWKYFDHPAAPAAAWKDASFNDESWASGPSAFGYGNGSVRTAVNPGPNPDYKTITNYFRRSIDISNPMDFAVFRINLYIGDGAAIYVNGKEVSRPYMWGGEIESSTNSSQINVDNQNTITTVDIASDFFKAGKNFIAVEVHKNFRLRRSMLFDLELIGVTSKNSPTVVRGPLLQMVNTGGITIRWKTNLPTTSTIRYGLTENALTGAVSDNNPVTDHELSIKGLNPDTRYYYAIGTNEYMMKGSYRTNFSTAPMAGSTRKIKIAVFGDPGTGDINQKRSRDRYLETNSKELNPDLALMLGDNAYPLGTDKDYQGGFFNIYNDNLFNNHTLFSVPGNHEYAGVAQVSDIAYFNIFSLPKAGESGGLASGTESYYSFNYGNIHFVMLNSYGLDNGKTLADTTSDQALWLKKDLAASAGKFKWTIACFHHSPYTNANHYSDTEVDLRSLREKITPILERYNVDLVLTGHSHSYERTFLIKNHTGISSSFNYARPPVGNMADSSSARYDGTGNSCPYILSESGNNAGTVYVVAGASGQLGGGNNPRWPLFYFKNYAATPGAECGSFTLEIEGNRLDGKYIGSHTGTVLDHFTIMKGAGKKKEIIEETNSIVKLDASWVGNYSWTSVTNPLSSISKSVSVNNSIPGTSTYLVRDNLPGAGSCIADTFVIRAYPAVTEANIIYTASQTQNEVLLKWTTEQEVNTDLYNLERSANGVEYTQIGSVAGSMLSTDAKDYSFSDRSPLQGNNYYRLSRVVKSGKRTELGVRSINFLATYSVKISAHTNPSPSAKVQLVIQNSRRQMLDLNIVDLLGASVYHKQWTVDAGTQTLTLKLRPGSYIISGKTMDGSTPSERIMVY